MHKPYRTATLVLASTIALSACVIAPPPRMAAGPTVIVRAPIQPPPPRVEVIPPAPRQGYLWIPGYWHWEANRHRWIDGHWEQHREHEHWVDHRWERDDHDQWRLNGGYWRHD
jgi:hypothetical protein